MATQKIKANLEVDGTVTASPATASTHLVTKAQLDTKQDILSSGNNIKTINGSSVLGSGDLVVNTVSSYKVYTALLIQSGANDPTTTILQSTLASPVSWTRSTTGAYLGTLSDTGTGNKTFIIVNQNNVNKRFTARFVLSSSTGYIFLESVNASTDANEDGLSGLQIEIRVYN
jgi:hypothetical protein